MYIEHHCWTGQSGPSTTIPCIWREAHVALCNDIYILYPIGLITLYRFVECVMNELIHECIFIHLV